MLRIDVNCPKSKSISRVLGSIVVSIPACHAGDRGSIPRRGGLLFFFRFVSVLIFNTHVKSAIDLKLVTLNLKIIS